jgi:hypothetical protein
VKPRCSFLSKSGRPATPSGPTRAAHASKARAAFLFGGRHAAHHVSAERPFLKRSLRIDFDARTLFSKSRKHATRKLSMLGAAIDTDEPSRTATTRPVMLR